MIKIRILMVENEILARHPVSEYLRECGYVVAEAAGPDEARRLLADSQIKVDIILANVGPARQSGFALATWVRSHNPSIRVILAGTIARLVEQAGTLCKETPRPGNHADHRIVLAEIRRRMGGLRMGRSSGPKSETLRRRAGGR
jgi:CheY-like chemotaxis protein